MTECRKCKYFPCMREECDIYYGECELGIRISQSIDRKEREDDIFKQRKDI